MARPISRAFALMLAFTLPSPALAEEPSLPEEAERLMGEGIASLMQALELLLKTVPQYAAPEMLPNGDIIIRRLQPQDEAPAPASPADPGNDSTDT